MPFGQAAPVAGILAIDDDEIEFVLGNKAGEPVTDGIAARPADDIAQKK